jgi:HEAT repeat protein
MALSRKKRLLLGLVVLAVVAGAVVSWQWYPIRVRMIVWGDGTPGEKEQQIRSLGLAKSIPALIGIFEGSSGSWDDKMLVGRILLREPCWRIKVLERSLDSDDATVRRVSTYLLVNSKNVDRGDRIFEVTRAWTEDAKWGNRIYLVQVLGHLGNPPEGKGDPRCVEMLGMILGGGMDESEDTRIYAARYLGTGFSAMPGATEILVKAVRSDPSPMVQARILQSLGSVGWVGDLDVYARVAESDDSIVRQLVAIALGNLRRKEGEEILIRLLGDRNSAVRRAALNALAAIDSKMVAEKAGLLREDSFMGVRGDLSLSIQDLDLMDQVPVLVEGLLESEPDTEYNVIIKTLTALNKLTGKHYGFDDKYFKQRHWGQETKYEIGGAWFSKPLQEKRQILAKWWDEYGAHDRRPFLLEQLAHADPANVARAVRELHLLKPDVETPGFTKKKVDASTGNFDPRHAPFLDLVDEARLFQALPDEIRTKHLNAWESLHR